MIKGLSPWDSREQSVARRRFNEPFLSNRILQRSWVFLLKWSVNVKSRYRPMRIKYLGVSHGNPKIRYWLVVSKVIKRTYNDVKPSEFWTLLLYQDLPFPKRRIQGIIPDIFPCYAVYRFDFRAVLLTTHMSSGHYSCTWTRGVSKSTPLQHPRYITRLISLKDLHCFLYYRSYGG